MSWLKRLIGGERASPPAGAQVPPQLSVVARGGRIVTVPELDLVGEHSVSPNGHYTLIWQDRGWTGDSSDPRGRYLLLTGGSVLVDARMERPQHGKVADNGTFIINDWGDSQQLSGTFHASRGHGSSIISHSYSANLLNNGLAPNGRLAVCQTCNAPGSADSSILTVFDVEAGTIVAAWTAESGWANEYEFPEGSERVRMLRGDRPSLDYSLTGEFLDRRLWLADEVERGTLHVIRKAMAEGEAATGLTTVRLRNGARAATVEGDARFRADAWRLVGEIEGISGDEAAALEAYERALALDPKVGVAKRAAALRKRLQQ